MKQLEYSSRNSRLLALELDIKVPIFDPMECTAKVANSAAIRKELNIYIYPIQRYECKITHVNVGREQTLTVSKTCSQVRDY